MTDKYQCNAQIRILRVVENLVGHEVYGLTLQELSEKTGVGTTTLYRDLQNLQIAEWVEQYGDKKWRLCVNAAKMLRAINDGLNKAFTKVNEARNLYQEI